MKSKNDHAKKSLYLKCTVNLNSNSKNEVFSLHRALENDEGRFNGGFLRYEFGGLIFGGAYFRNFTVYDPCKVDDK